MNEMLILFIFAFVLGAAAMYKLCKKYSFGNRSQHPKTKAVDLMDVLTIVERMNTSKNRLMEIEQMLTNVQLCDDEHIQKVCCSWDMGGEEQAGSYTFNLSSNANYFVVIAENERKELRASLLRDVDELVTMRRYGVTQSITQSIPLKRQGRVIHAD